MAQNEVPKCIANTVVQPSVTMRNSAGHAAEDSLRFKIPEVALQLKQFRQATFCRRRTEYH